jgi:hypothetical protein
VLLTASTSQDVFSRAVNTAGLDQATSVVVNEDGSFTLGNGANVVNSGTIDASTASSDQGVGRIVLLGENVTSSGELRADAASGNAGEIGLHAQNTTLLTGNGITSVRAALDGEGCQGNNPNIRKARWATVAPETATYARAVSQGYRGINDVSYFT